MFHLLDHHYARRWQRDRSQILSGFIRGKCLRGIEHIVLSKNVFERADYRPGTIKERGYIAGMLLREELAVL